MTYTKSDLRGMKKEKLEKLIKETGVSVRGSGKHGDILKEDIIRSLCSHYEKSCSYEKKCRNGTRKSGKCKRKSGRKSRSRSKSRSRKSRSRKSKKRCSKSHSRKGHYRRSKSGRRYHVKGSRVKSKKCSRKRGSKRGSRKRGSKRGSKRAQKSKGKSKGKHRYSKKEKALKSSRESRKKSRESMTWDDIFGYDKDKGSAVSNLFDEDTSSYKVADPLKTSTAYSDYDDECYKPKSKKCDDDYPEAEETYFDVEQGKSVTAKRRSPLHKDCLYRSRRECPKK